MNVRSKAVHGFTMIEILLSMAIVTIIMAMTAPIYQRLQVTNDVKVTSQLVAEKIKRAQQLSMAAKNDSAWGVRIASGTLYIFRGTNFAGRDQSYDEPTAISPATTVTGLTELTFTKVTGVPSATGTITITHSGNQSTVSINSVGTVTIQ